MYIYITKTVTMTATITISMTVAIHKIVIARHKSTPRKSPWICPVGCSNGFSVAFSKGLPLVQWIVTAPIDV